MTDWTDWLGPAADEMTDEQRERFEAEAEAAIERIGADPDLDWERQTVLAAISQYILGETTLDEVGAERRRTVREERDACLVAQQVARLAVLDGMPEAEAARRAGIDRMTVRRMLGKR